MLLPRGQNFATRARLIQPPNRGMPKEREKRSDAAKGGRRKKGKGRRVGVASVGCFGWLWCAFCCAFACHHLPTSCSAHSLTHSPRDACGPCTRNPLGHTQKKEDTLECLHIIAAAHSLLLPSPAPPGHTLCVVVMARHKLFCPPSFSPLP